MCNRVVAAITLMLRTVPKKNTQRIEQLAWCAHEEGEQSRHTQINGDDYSWVDGQTNAHTGCNPEQLVGCSFLGFKYSAAPMPHRVDDPFVSPNVDQLSP